MHNDGLNIRTRVEAQRIRMSVQNLPSNRAARVHSTNRSIRRSTVQDCDKSTNKNKRNVIQHRSTENSECARTSAVVGELQASARLLVMRCHHDAITSINRVTKSANRGRGDSHAVCADSCEHTSVRNHKQSTHSSIFPDTRPTAMTSASGWNAVSKTAQ